MHAPYIGELASFLDGAWSLLDLLILNYPHNLPAMLDFFRVDSAFYPGIDAFRRLVESDKELLCWLPRKSIASWFVALVAVLVRGDFKHATSYDPILGQGAG